MSDPAWVKCLDCEDYICTVHSTFATLVHAHECSCPPIDEWKVNPYGDGGKPLIYKRKLHGPRTVPPVLGLGCLRCGGPLPGGGSKHLDMDTCVVELYNALRVLQQAMNDPAAPRRGR